MLKTFGKKMGLVDKELGQFKKCIDKVQFLAECVVTEKDRVKRVNRPAAASAAYTPLLSGQDEGSCSQENLNIEIRRLKQEGDMPTLELITCYRNLRDNPEFNRQIEESRHKEVYKKICLGLAEEEKREEEKRKQREAEMWVYKWLAGVELGERAVPLYEELLTKQKRVLGDNHPDTLSALVDLAVLFFSRGEYDRAEPLLEECLARNRRVLGDNHPVTLTSKEFLDDCRKQQQKEGAAQAQAQAQAQAPVPIEIQSTTLPTLSKNTGGKSKNKRNHKNKSFRSTRRRRYSRARGGKKIAALSSKTIKRRRKNAR